MRDAFWHLLLVGVLGTLGAIIGVAGIVVLVAIAVYRIRGDRTWSVKWALSMKTSEEGGTLRQDSVQLVCSGHPPVDVASLGYVDAVVRLPTGEWRQMTQDGMSQGKSALSFSVLGQVHGPIPSGKYEVRWYGTNTRVRRFEIARSKFTVR